MKKITFLAAALVATMGFSQTDDFPYDFETDQLQYANVNAVYTGSTIVNDQLTGTNTDADDDVVKMLLTGSATLNKGIVFSTATDYNYASGNNTLTFKIMFDTAGPHDIRFRSYVNGVSNRVQRVFADADITGGGAIVANTWYTVTFTADDAGNEFNGDVTLANVTETAFSHFIISSSTVSGHYYLDDIEHTSGTLAGVDADEDGFDSIETGGTDCDDTDDQIFPGSTELIGTIDDEDCDDTWNDGASGFTSLPLNFDTDSNQLAYETGTTVRFETSSAGGVGTVTTNTKNTASNKSTQLTYVLDEAIDISTISTGKVDLLINIAGETDGAAINAGGDANFGDPDYSVEVRFADGAGLTSPTVKYVPTVDNGTDGAGTLETISFDIDTLTDEEGNALAPEDQITEVDRIYITFGRFADANTLTGDYFKIDNLTLDALLSDDKFSVEKATLVDTKYFNILGQPVSEDAKGLVIKKEIFSNGTVKSTTEFRQ